MREDQPSVGDGPELTDQELAALREAARLFDAGCFFECHDVLEDAWSGVRGPSRDFLQGLIQVAVGFYHLGNGNPAGAVSLFGRALARLAPYPDFYLGLDLARHRAEVAGWKARIEGGDTAAPPLEALPKWGGLGP